MRNDLKSRGGGRIWGGFVTKTNPSSIFPSQNRDDSLIPRGGGRRTRARREQGNGYRILGSYKVIAGVCARSILGRSVARLDPDYGNTWPSAILSSFVPEGFQFSSPVTPPSSSPSSIHRFFHSISFFSFFFLFFFFLSLFFFFFFFLSLPTSLPERLNLCLIVDYWDFLGGGRKEGRRKLAGCLPRLPCLRQGNWLGERKRERKERRKRLVDQRETLILFLRETFDGGGRSPSK